MKQPKIKVSEKQVSKQITDWLNLNRIFWFYCPNKGLFDTSRDPSTPGAPDIVVVIGGKIIGVELKSTRGKQSEAQIEFQQQLEAAGGIYLLARSYDDLHPTIKELLKRKRIFETLG
jgi:hypothetical protein